MDSKHANGLVALPYFPDEIIVDIFSHLPRDGRLASIALVSRRFRNLVEEFLYHTVNLNLPCSDEERTPFSRGEPPPYHSQRLYKFMESLSANSELG